MSSSNNRWSIVESKALLSVVESYGTSFGWRKIRLLVLDQIPDCAKTAKQMCERYRSHGPHVLNRQWCKQETDIILAEQRKLGSRWVAIGSILEAKGYPGRSDRAIKNHYYALLRSQARANGS